jgi:Transposase DDE domain
LYDDGVQLIPRLKLRMRNRLMPLLDKIMLRKRAIIESVMDQLKNISRIEHSRHRSVANCFVNLLGGLIAYTGARRSRRSTSVSKSSCNCRHWFSEFLRRTHVIKINILH